MLRNTVFIWPVEATVLLTVCALLHYIAGKDVMGVVETGSDLWVTTGL